MKSLCFTSFQKSLSAKAPVTLHIKVLRVIHKTNFKGVGGWL